MADPAQSRFRLPHWGWFLLATVVLVIGSVGLSVWLPWHREQQVIQVIEGWGGKVDTQTGGPDWLWQLLGKDRMTEFKVFDRVSYVQLDYMEITDAEIARLSTLTNLKGLSLDVTAVTDSSLAHLSRLPNLNSLSLIRTSTTDSGLAHLSRMTNLKLLLLNGSTAVTDKSLAHLSRLTKLRSLSLRNTAVTDAGLNHLKRMKQMVRLAATGTRVTEAGAQQLAAALPQCKIEWDGGVIEPTRATDPE